MTKNFKVTYEPMVVADKSARADLATFKPAGYEETTLISAENAKAARAWFNGGNNGRIVSVQEVA